VRRSYYPLMDTAQVYTVIIDRTPTCNCKAATSLLSSCPSLNSISGPDATKGNHCKHIVRCNNSRMAPVSDIYYLSAIYLSQRCGHTSLVREYDDLNTSTVLQVSQQSGLWYQKCVLLLSSKYFFIFTFTEQSPPDVRASNNLRTSALSPELDRPSQNQRRICTRHGQGHCHCI
jgi:hypothetical protein